MNRRSFIERLSLGLAGFTILPGAGRIWKAEREPVIPWTYYEHPSRINALVDSVDALYPRLNVREQFGEVRAWSSHGLIWHAEILLTRSQIERVEKNAGFHGGICGLCKFPTPTWRYLCRG